MCIARDRACTSSSTACTRFLSEPEASAVGADDESCMRRRSGLFEVAGKARQHRVVVQS